VDFVRRRSENTEINAGRLIEWLDITASKFYDWRERHGRANEHNAWVPRDFWLEEWEKQVIIGSDGSPLILVESGVRGCDLAQILIVSLSAAAS
jgi:hypothetical protein